LSAEGTGGVVDLVWQAHSIAKTQKVLEGGFRLVADLHSKRTMCMFSEQYVAILINSGSKLPSWSRGTSIGSAPSLPFSVLRVVPLRRLL
jgi:hypothetical protein